MDATSQPVRKHRSARPVAPLPETLHPEQRISLALVCALSGRGRTKVFEGVADGTFPAPERDGPRCSRWRAGDVLDWLAAKRERPQKPKPKPVPPETTALLAAIAALREAGLDSLQDLTRELQTAMPPATAMPSKARGRPANALAVPDAAPGASVPRKRRTHVAAVPIETT